MTASRDAGGARALDGRAMKLNALLAVRELCRALQRRSPRLLILEDPQQNLVVARLVNEGFIGQYWLAVPNGIAFAPAIGSNEKLLLGTQLAMNDVVISRYAVRTEQETLRLVERDVDRTNGIPLFTAAGDIDGDTMLDGANEGRER